METNEYAKIPENSQIVPKHSLYDEIYKAKCIEYLCKEIKIIPDYSKYRVDNELIKYCCSKAENFYEERKLGEKKRDIVMQAFIKSFNLSSQEQKSISDTIEFLSNNKKIKKLNVYKKYVKPFGEWILKKLLR